MPAQPLLIAAAGGDEVLAVVDQQADVKRGAVEVSAGELLDSFLERGAGDCEGVDRVRLAPLARGAPGAGHVLGSHTDDPLAAGDQEPLERAGDVPAVLDRPYPLCVECPRPPQQFPERVLARGHG